MSAELVIQEPFLETVAKKSLSSSCMLVTLQVSCWLGSKTDRATGQKLAEENKAEEQAIRVQKQLLPAAEAKKIQAAANRVRLLWRYHTLPWLADGTRILSNKGYHRFQKEMQEAVLAFNQTAAEIWGSWASLILQSQERLGSLARAEDYPRDIQSYYKIDYTILPFPAAGDFRVEAMGEAAQEIASGLERLHEESLRSAQAEVGERIKATVGRFIEQLPKYDPKNPKAHPFRDSLVENCRALLELLPALNVAQDPALEAIRSDLEALCSHEAAELREDAGLRYQKEQEAKDILKKLGLEW